MMMMVLLTMRGEIGFIKKVDVGGGLLEVKEE